jgi:hypothetical protein
MPGALWRDARFPSNRRPAPADMRAYWRSMGHLRRNREDSRTAALLRWLASPAAARAAGAQARRMRLAIESPDPRRHASGVAEALIARRVARLRLPIAFESPTPSGRTCDVDIRDGDLRLCLHVKHLASSPAKAPPRRARMPAAFMDLARQTRRVVIALEWRPRASAADLRHAAQDALLLLNRGSVGDEARLHARDGGVIGHARLVAPTDARQTVVIAGIPDRGALDGAERLLRKAYVQFMPRAHNVIVVAGAAHDSHAFADALLGPPIERWDRFPHRGERMAHGRAHDGFWSGRTHPGSALAAWMSLDEAPRFQCWMRDGMEPPAAALGLCERVFGAAPQRLR